MSRGLGDVYKRQPLIHHPVGKLITFFDIAPIPIANTPIPNSAFVLLLARRDFIRNLYLF